MSNIDLTLLCGLLLLFAAVGAILMRIHCSISLNVKDKIIEELKSDKAFYAQMLKRFLWGDAEGDEQQKDTQGAWLNPEPLVPRDYKPQPPVARVTESDPSEFEIPFNFASLKKDKKAEIRLRIATALAATYSYTVLPFQPVQQMASFKKHTRNGIWRINVFVTTGSIVVNLNGHKPFTIKDRELEDWRAIFGNPDGILFDLMEKREPNKPA